MMDWERTEKNFLKFFLGLAGLIILAWLTFWGTVLGVGLFLFFKYLV